MASMVFTAAPLSAQSSCVKRLITNTEYSGSSWVPKSSVKVSSCVQHFFYKNISVESSKSSFIQGDGFSAFSLPKSSRVLPISKSPSLNAILPGPGAEDFVAKSIHRFTAKQHGKDISLKEYQGKILLIVNIPEQGSKWTNSQIKYLNDLHAEYSKRGSGFEILGFLYDKEETPGSDDSEEIIDKEEIIEAQIPNFPIFDKVKLNDKHEIQHKWRKPTVDEEKRKKDVWYFLKNKTDVQGGDVEGAFEKFLVDGYGILTGRYPRFPLGDYDPLKNDIKAYFS